MNPVTAEDVEVAAVAAAAVVIDLVFAVSNRERHAALAWAPARTLDVLVRCGNRRCAGSDGQPPVMSLRGLAAHLASSEAAYWEEMAGELGSNAALHSPMDVLACTDADSATWWPVLNGTSW